MNAYLPNRPEFQNYLGYFQNLIHKRIKEFGEINFNPSHKSMGCGFLPMENIFE